MLTPRVVAARGDSEHTGHRGDAETGLIRAHEPVDLPGPVSLANQAVAFARSSAMCRSAFMRALSIGSAPSLLNRVACGSKLNAHHDQHVEVGLGCLFMAVTHRVSAGHLPSSCPSLPTGYERAANAGHGRIGIVGPSFHRLFLTPCRNPAGGLVLPLLIATCLTVPGVSSDGLTRRRVRPCPDRGSGSTRTSAVRRRPTQCGTCRRCG